MNESSPNLPRRALGRARRWFDGQGTMISRLEAELRAERERIDRLEADLDELRRDSLRVAELIDLAEQAFTPGVPAPDQGPGASTPGEPHAPRS